MIEAIMFWNEPNNLSHWDFEIDRDWRQFSEMTQMAAEAVRSIAPNVRLVLGGISPIDPDFMRLIASYGLISRLDAVAVHGFPLDWNHWQIQEWPDQVSRIQEVIDIPVWVTEVGVSSFGADEVQIFGLKKTADLLLGRVERIFWYSLLDLPPTWEATTRHKESEGSAYYRHFHMGLIRADGTPKPALKHFNPELGVCQWIHFQDRRLSTMLYWLRKLGVTKLRTGISWADWHRPGGRTWFDQQMKALEEFDLTVTLCFTPVSRGQRACHTSPPINLEEFATFATEVACRYLVPQAATTGRYLPDEQEFGCPD
nr:beta-xylosidase [Deltaproteobacteria bacterium]